MGAWGGMGAISEVVGSNPGACNIFAFAFLVFFMGLFGLTGLIGLIHHQVTRRQARQVTFQVTYGMRRGANRTNRGVGGEPGAP